MEEIIPLYVVWRCNTLFTGSPAKKTRPAGGSILPGNDQRNRLASILPVSLKIPVSGEDNWIVMNLGHPDQAGVGKAHRNVLKPAYQSQRLLKITIQGESGRDDPSFQQSTKDIGTITLSSQQEKALGDYRFATQARYSESLKVRFGPRLMLVAPAKRCHNRAAIDQYGSCHSLPCDPCSTRDRAAGILLRSPDPPCGSRAMFLRFGPVRDVRVRFQIS
jgi:hypothetical protein